MSVTSVTYYPGAGPAFTSVATVGPVEWLDPLPKQSSPVMFRQAFMQAITSFSALALDTAHPALTAFLLVRESDFSVVGGGIQKWHRYFATTPPQRVEYSTQAATFPGYATAAVSRPPYNTTSSVKITYDYFLLGALPALATESLLRNANGVTVPLLSDNYVANSGFFANASIPDYTTYEAYFVLDSTVPTSFSLFAEAQSLDQWEGNFHVRKTVAIKAK
jgi:hypothetical protein